MDLATAQAKLSAALAAYDDALVAYSRGIGDKQVTHQKLETLRGEITFWQRQIDGYAAVAAGSAPGVAIASWS